VVSVGDCEYDWLTGSAAKGWSLWHYCDPLVDQEPTVVFLPRTRMKCTTTYNNDTTHDITTINLTWFVVVFDGWRKSDASTA
jgi:hypothetical protein